MYPPTFRNKQMKTRKIPVKLSNHEVVNCIYKIKPTDPLYKQIKYLVGNRPIKENHVNLLAESIEKAGEEVLKTLPILLKIEDGEYVIVDGQHRYVACVLRLGIPIYVMLVDETVNNNIIVTLNTNKSNWLDMDFANYYASQGLKPYKVFIDYMNQYKFITAGIMISIFNKEFSRNFGNSSQDFKNGALTLRHIDHVDKTIKRLKLLKNVARNPDIEESTFKRQQFQSALLKMFLSHKFKFNKFRTNLRTSKHNFNKLARQTDMFKQMNEIYLGKRLNK